ncbi:MAG: HD domain-containing protein [Candidatus Helarchaeota archaeon]
MYTRLLKIFNNYDVNLVDDNRIDILETELYKSIINIDPQIREIFNLAIQSDKFEFLRTIRHIFRVLIVYFKILNDKFKPPGKLNNLEFNQIKHLIKKINNRNKEILPCIFLLHDIGKPFNRRFHPEESAKIVDNYQLAENFNLKEDEKIVVKKTIEYHLMMGTIYNGESSLWKLLTFRSDPETDVLLLNKNLELFLDILVIFAIMDIWGYPYGIVSKTNINEYLNLKSIFQYLLSFDNYKFFKNKLDELAIKRIDWRISSGLRIFQYYNTKPLYSMEFFLRKIWNAIYRYNGIKITDENWNEYKQKYLSQTIRAQIHYGLPVLMRLTLGNFERRNWKINEDTIVQTDLIQFWISLNQKIKKYAGNLKDFPINLVLNGIPHWSKFNKQIIGLFKGEIISKLIEESEILTASNLLKKLETNAQKNNEINKHYNKNIGNYKNIDLNNSTNYLKSIKNYNSLTNEYFLILNFNEYL